MAASANFSRAALSGAAAADGLQQGFNGSFPPYGWTVIDEAETGVEWKRNTAWGDANWTGGIGACAEVSSSHSPGLDYNTTLQSPVFTVPPDAVLFFRANYQNFMGQDHLEVRVRVGANVYSLLGWSEDHGDFESTPGDGAVVDVSTWAGEAVRLEFHYYDDAGSIHDDYYIQVDDVIVDDETSVRQTRWGSIKALYR
jgi:hypothetical protein